MVKLFSTIDGLKRAAKNLKRETGMTHAQALDHLARTGGFQNFVHASRLLCETPSMPRFPVTISLYWSDRKTNTRGTESIQIHLSQPIDRLIRPHHLKGYLGGVQLQGENRVCDQNRKDNQAHARILACRLARVFQFMDVTGLKPSIGKRFYPGSDWHNRPPGADHDQGWYDPQTKIHLLTDEPYGFSEDIRRMRIEWCERHGFDILQSRWASIYGYGTELYLIARRETSLDLRSLLAKLEASSPPISEEDWGQYVM